MRRQLIVIVLAVTSMVAIAFLVPLATEVRTQAAERALAVADQESQSLAGVLASDPTDAGLVTVVDQLNAGQNRVAAVYLPDGRRIGPALDPPAAELSLARQGRSFTAAGRSSTDVWTAVRLAGGVSVAEVSVPDAELRDGVTRAWILLALVGMFVVAAGVVLADRLGRSIVRPVQALGAVTRRLRAGDLDARIAPTGPAEVADVAVAVNGLADRIAELLRLEREAAADLSHSLRTPLAALRLEVDSLRSADERHRMARAADEVTDALDDLIRQVRAGEPVAVEADCDLVDVVAGRLEFWELLAREQDRPVTVELPRDPVPVAASGTQLRQAVDALIGNVFAHTPPGTALTVSVDRRGHGALVVADAGPGFGEDIAPARGRSGAGSTGLGLDIARRTARASGGDLVVSRGDGGGARIEVTFGPTGSGSFAATGPAPVAVR